MAMHHTISRRDATAPPWPSRRMPAASGRHQPAPEATRVVMWGTYDISKPRNRILVEGLRQAGVELIECHAEVWAGVEDKSQVAAWWPRLRLLLCWLACYPALVVRYMCLPSHDAVVVGYIGELDILILWPFAKLRGVPIVWDSLMSLYGAIVDDRKMLRAEHPVARLLLLWERLSARAADHVIVNNGAAAEYWRTRFKVPSERLSTVLIGVEADAFSPRAPGPDRLPASATRVLFYGTFLPSHGVETIVEAARLMEGERVHWTIIGQGQEAPSIRSMLDHHPLAQVEWIDWIPYEELAAWIHGADVCLGLFGDVHRANLAIPNKVLQILSAGSPIITRDSDAIRELLQPEMEGVYLVPPADPRALADAVRTISTQRHALARTALHTDVVERIKPRAIGGAIRGLVRRLLEERAEARPTAVGHAAG